METNRIRETNLEQEEKGITLVALIITIIILVILAAVSIAAVYNSKIVNYAINGTLDYATQAVKENKVLDETTKLIDSAVENLSNMLGGNKPEEPTPPEVVGKTKEELSQTSMIGQYVDYKPQGTDYTVESQYSGADANQTFSANNSMKWRIWGVEENKLLLISETLAGNIELQGAEGYNNAVKILNDACSTAFGNSTYGSGITVRSINQDDIDKVTNMTTDAQRTVAYSNYGTTATPRNTNWPNIYGQEPGKTGGGTLDRSSQSSWYTGSTNSSFTGKWTFYGYGITDYATQTMYDALLTNMTASSTTGTDNPHACWVASRCANVGNGSAHFLVFILNGGKVNAMGLYDAAGGGIRMTMAVRPMGEVNLDSIAIGGTGTGTASSPYSMIKIRNSSIEILSAIMKK